MAVTANKAESKLKILYYGETDEETGEEEIKSKTYSRVKADATDENIYTAASSIVSLQNLTLNTIKKLEEYDLINQA